MLKILVPTDFSSNSKKGLKFAMQWSAQQNAELIFMYVLYVPRLPQWTDKEYLQYTETEEIYWTKRLQKFVRSVYRYIKSEPKQFQCVVKPGISADLSIMEYCRQRGDINYICIATRGAGKLNKFFGTHTGNLITKSTVPVIAVPQNYRKSAVKTILYATDFAGFEEELQQVSEFAHSLKAKIIVVHVAFPNEAPGEEAIYHAFGKKKAGVELKIVRANIVNSLYKNLEIEINKMKPSLVVMFTHRDRNFLQKIIYPSGAENLSFETNVPLLVFPKKS
ncbi:MAG: universal stress protein [Bacteroidetes bacterium]|nr:universal stress protein [Bacteroidota bacterium]